MEFNTKNNEIRRNSFTDIPQQFPTFYREEGPILIDFMRTYYEWADSLEHEFRDVYNIRSIDATYERFLIYFKNKYLANIPFNSSTNIRFVVKHIQDLYRRKGSEESLHLLFRLFFNEEIEVFYPTSNILRISDSIYSFNEFLEMVPVSSFTGYPVTKGDKLIGDVSHATAFADRVVFYNSNGIIIPIIFLSNTLGKFVKSDSLSIQNTRNETPLLTNPIIQGSINQVEVITNSQRIPGNKVGDILSIVSDGNGTGGLAIVTAITETSTGTIDFSIENSGFGYDLNPVIKISNQVVVLGMNQPSDFSIGDIINGNGGEGEVIEFDKDQNILFLKTSTAFDSSTSNLTNTSKNFDFTAVNISLENSAANFEVSRITDEETVIIITDIIGDFLTVPLDSSNYGMSGAGEENLNTTLRDAFISREFTIGSIDSINILDEGLDYVNDVRTTITQSEIAKFQKRNIGITFDNIDFVLQQGDIITQSLEIEDFTYQANTIPYEVRAEFVKRNNETFFFEQKSFFGFDNDFPVRIRNNEYNIVTLIEDQDSRPMGTNGIVKGTARFQRGQVEQASVTSTGFFYEDGEQVYLKDSNDTIVATARIQVRGTGFTEGQWTTTTSFLNESSKVIHDNFYYQEYSYDVSTIVNPNLYNQLTRDLIQVGGTKQFNSPLINTVNNIKVSDAVVFEIFDLTFPEYINEDDIPDDVELMVEDETNDIYIGVVANINQEATDAIQTQIENS